MKYWKTIVIIAAITALVNVGMWNEAYAKKGGNGKGKGGWVSQGEGSGGKGHDKGNHNNDRGKGHGRDCGDSGDDNDPGNDDTDDNGSNESRGKGKVQRDSDKYRAPTPPRLIYHCDYPLNYWFDSACK